MLEHGYDIHPIADGQIHRFRGPDDKNKNGWYVYHGHFGAFGNWRTGLTVKWSERDKMSADERRDLSRQIQAADRKRQRETKQRHERVADEAQALWQKATPVIGHTYLSRKRVLSHGLRVYGIHLVVPMFRDGKLWNLQKIAPDGTKRFLTGGKVCGCYFPVGRPEKQLWLAEGYATAATLHELTGDAVAVCFSAGNLTAVAQRLNQRLPGIRILVGADNDETGLKNASRAAAIVGSVYVVPEFDPGHDGSDWNDFRCRYGAQFTREAIRG